VKIGRTSCELRIEASLGGELRMRVKQVLVFISAANARATAIPPELINRMHRFAAPPEAPMQQRAKPRAKVPGQVKPA
jgi:acyl-CoA thioesterase FadM